MKGFQLIATGGALPGRTVTNEELSRTVDTSDAWITSRTGTRNNGVRVRPGLYVLRRTKMPAILVELAYLTNAQDALRLETDPFGFAQGIMNGILDYFA